MTIRSKRAESFSSKQSRAHAIESLLRKTFPAPKIALQFLSPLQLLISVILSAQCTDARVNIVTPSVFKKYRTAKDFAKAAPSQLEEMIHSTGFFRNKARNIIECCKILVSEHGGDVPSSMEELLKLPGVGRKTANCVLGGAFGVSAGIVVDTHVIRVATRLGLTSNTNPEKIESDLCEVIDKKDWIHFGNAVVLHGRSTCDARKPQCDVCVLKGLCHSAGNWK